MNVRIIDTSVILNMLEVPDMCEDAPKIKAELEEAIKARETLILPIAAIIETGNHIAHISDGRIRRVVAGKFGEYLRKTAEGEAPWRFYGAELDKDGLLYLADHIEDNATRKIGIEDMSIVYTYEQFKKKTPAIGTIMIWSTDAHLCGYREDHVSMSGKRRQKNRLK